MMRSQMVLSALRCTWEATCDRIKHAWKQRDRPSLILVSCVRRDCVMCCVSVCQTVIYTFCVTLNASFVADWHTVEFATAHCRILRGTLYLPQTPCMSVEVDARRRTDHGHPHDRHTRRGPATMHPMAPPHGFKESQRFSATGILGRGSPVRRGGARAGSARGDSIGLGRVPATR